MKKIVLFAIVLLFLFIMPVYASDQEISLDEIEKTARDQTNLEVSVQDMVDAFRKGKILDMIKELFLSQIKQFFSEGKEIKELLIQMLMVGFFMAIFQNLSKSFLEQYIGSTGFYVAYLILSGLLIRQFLIIYELAETGLDDVLVFMKALIPTYSLAVLSVSGISTSLASYELFFLLITGVQWGILRIILPCIKLGFVLKLLNFMAKEDLFSGIIDLLESLIKLMLKGAIMVVLLFNVFQSMLLPAIDSVKSNVIQKGLNFLPGIGQVFGMVANTAIGSGVILKNAIGVFGMIMICVIIFVPIIKIFLYMESFQLAGAILQPITDKKIYQIFKNIAGSGKLLLQAILTGGVLFLLTIAMVSMTTNLNYYVG
jgi:stage III sporulation protein AE